MSNKLDPQFTELLGKLGLNTDLSALERRVLDTESYADRPPVPASMLGLTCAEDHTTICAIGDAYDDSGFNAKGQMTIAITSPTQQLGCLEITKRQAAQLRDYLISKLGE